MITLVFKQGIEFEEIDLAAVVVFSYTHVKDVTKIVVVKHSCLNLRSCNQ